MTMTVRNLSMQPFAAAQYPPQRHVPHIGPAIAAHNKRAEAREARPVVAKPAKSTKSNSKGAVAGKVPTVKRVGGAS